MRSLVSGDALVRMTRATKLCADALVPALVLVACSASTGPSGSPSAGVSASAVSVASCSGSSCSVTLAGTGSRVQILGATISFEEVRDGQAAVRVDDQAITCTEGQSASAGALTLTCTDVTSNSVTMTVSLG